MKIIIYLFFIISICSCGINKTFEKIYVLTSLSKEVIYSKNYFKENFIPTTDNIKEIQENIFSNKVYNENDIFSKKTFLNLKPGIANQFSGAIDLNNNKIVFVAIIYKDDCLKFDFENNNYIWFNICPFSKNKRKFIVLKYNLTNKNVIILNPTDYPKLNI